MQPGNEVIREPNSYVSASLVSYLNPTGRMTPIARATKSGVLVASDAEIGPTRKRPQEADVGMTETNGGFV